jgi:hypothetical protein
MKPRPRKPKIIMAQVAGSGTAALAWEEAKIGSVSV